MERDKKELAQLREELAKLKAELASMKKQSLIEKN